MTVNSQELAKSITIALRSEGGLAVPLRALLAGTLMCERGGSPSRLGMSKVGKFSYGSSQNNYSDLLTAIVEELPRALDDMMSDGTDPVLAAKLRANLQDRDGTIRQLRRDLAVVEQSQEDLRRYALALHQRLGEIASQGAAEKGAKVSPLFPLP